MSTASPIKRLKDGRIECVVSFPKEKVDGAEHKALEELAAHIELPGFRAGKVPPDLAREKIDQDKLFERTIHHLLPEAFESLVKEHEIKPIVRPKVEAQSRDPLTVKITFVEKPKVAVKSANKIRIDRKPHAVEEKDVEKMINYVTERHKTVTPVDRASREGDQITWISGERWTARKSRARGRRGTRWKSAATR